MLVTTCLGIGAAPRDAGGETCVGRDVRGACEEDALLCAPGGEGAEDREAGTSEGAQRGLLAFWNKVVVRLHVHVSDVEQPVEACSIALAEELGFTPLDIDLDEVE